MGDVLSSGFCEVSINGTNTTEVTNEDAPHAIFFVFCVFVTGVAVRCILKFVPIPYTVVLFILGTLFGIATNRYEELRHFTTVIRMEPKLLLEVFLPILIFDAAFSMDAHTFRKCAVNVILLAVPGVLMCSSLSAVFSKFVFLSYELNWPMALIYGSILSATDPVAVVALLREVGASQKSSVLIEGESLLNDGTAIVLYQVLIKVMTKGISAGGIALYSLQITVGGPLAGIVIGKLAVFCLSHVYNDAITEITITISATYLAYYISENALSVSGVLACASLGVFLSANKACVSPEVEPVLHSFWSLLGYLANTLIFVIAGVLITERAVEFVENPDWFLILATYMSITFFRFAMVAMLSPILSRTGYGLTWREAILLVWGGLRGAVGLALGLALAQDRRLLLCNAQQKVFIHVAGIVVLTLVINAFTLKLLLKVLGMTEISRARHAAMAHAVNHLHEVVEQTSRVQKMNRCLADTNWMWVNAHTAIKNPYADKQSMNEKTDELIIKHSKQTNCPSCSNTHAVQPSDTEMQRCYEEARLKILKAQKVFFWHLFENGLLSRRSIGILIALADVAADREGEYIDTDELLKYVKPPKLYASMRDKVWVLVRYLHYGKSQQLYDASSPYVLDAVLEAYSPKSSWRQKISRFIKHAAFRPIVYLAIVFCTITIAFAIREVVNKNNLKGSATYNFLEACHFFAVAFYSAEVVIKVIGCCWKHYWLSKWNRFAVVVTILSIIGMIFDFIAFSIKRNNPQAALILLVTAKLMPMLMVLRLFNLIEPFLQLILKFLTVEVHNQMYDGYDIGRGFIISLDEISRKINKMADYPPLTLKLREMINERKLAVLKEQIKMRKMYPEIVAAANTHFAARKILNETLRDVDWLASEGLLDCSEELLLEKTIHDMIRRLSQAPAAIPVSMRPGEVLNKITWFMDSKLFSFISKNMTIETLPEGFVIHEVGQLPSGIRIISSGVVKVYGETTKNTDNFLQNSDSYSYFSTTGTLTDYVSTSFVLGIFGILNTTPFVTNAVCETDVECIFIALDHIRQAIQEFTEPPTLLYKIWRDVAIEIAMPLIIELPVFQNLTYDQIRMKVENSVMPDLEKVTEFDLDANLEAVFLIQGFVESRESGTQYRGPCCLHFCTRKLFIPGDIKTRARPVMLLIAPPGYMVATEFDWSGESYERAHRICEVHGKLKPKTEGGSAEDKVLKEEKLDTYTESIAWKELDEAEKKSSKDSDSLNSLNVLSDVYRESYKT